MERPRVKLTVYGTPRPQGSTKAFIPKNWKRAIITTDNKKLKPWRQEVTGAAAALNVVAFGEHVPLAIRLNFYFDRPASVSAKKRPAMTVKPDGDKLVRAVFDSLKGVLYHDDAQIVDHRSRKYYGGPERVEIELWELCGEEIT